MTEERLAEVFLELADTLVDEFDSVDFLSTLTERSVEMLQVDAAGVIIQDARGNLHVVASTDHRAEILELFELQNTEGPCLDCLHSGRAVVNVTVDDAAARWPRFTAAAADVGFRSAHALPLRLRDTFVGAMNLFRVDEAPLVRGDMALGQALADIATIGLLQERAVRESGLLARQLQSALTSRVAIEQAKGVLLASADIEVNRGFGLMRSYSRHHRLPLRHVAQQVVDGHLAAAELQGL
jgi:hypothetical protein